MRYRSSNNLGLLSLMIVMTLSGWQQAMAWQTSRTVGYHLPAYRAQEAPKADPAPTEQPAAAVAVAPEVAAASDATESNDPAEISAKKRLEAAKQKLQAAQEKLEAAEEKMRDEINAATERANSDLRVRPGLEEGRRRQMIGMHVRFEHQDNVQAAVLGRSENLFGRCRIDLPARRIIIEHGIDNGREARRAV